MLFLLLELSESIVPLVLLVRWHEPYPHSKQNRTVPLVYRYTPNINTYTVYTHTHTHKQYRHVLSFLLCKIMFLSCFRHFIYVYLLYLIKTATWIDKNRLTWRNGNTNPTVKFEIQLTDPPTMKAEGRWDCLKSSPVMRNGTPAVQEQTYNSIKVTLMWCIKKRNTAIR